MRKMVGFLLIASGAVLGSTAAIAGVPVAPAPLALAGIPALLAIGAGYVIARKRRG